jgi:hypothetical protein
MRLLKWILALGLLPATAGAAELVSNGSFESPDFGVFNFVTVNAGASTIDSWQVGGTSVDVVGCGGCFHSGDQAIDVAGSPGPGELFQDLATVAGTTYRLTFFASSNRGAILDSLIISWDGVVIDTIDTPGLGTFQQFTYDLVATDASTELRFIDNQTTDFGPLLDTVSVVDLQDPVPTPSPAALPLLGSALLLLAGFRRRR